MRSPSECAKSEGEKQRANAEFVDSKMPHLAMDIEKPVSGVRGVPYTHSLCMETFFRRRRRRRISFVAAVLSPLLPIAHLIAAPNALAEWHPLVRHHCREWETIVGAKGR